MGMTTDPAPLPALPEPFMELHRELSPAVYDAWADQMRAYARAAIAAQTAPDAALLTAVRLVLDCHQEQLPMALDALRDIAGDAPVAQQAAPTIGYVNPAPHAAAPLVTSQVAYLNLTPTAAAHAQQPAVCKLCGGSGEVDSGGSQPWGEPIYIACECTYAEIGRLWHQDSSLEKWFPITAQILAALKAENEALKAAIPAPTTDTGER